MKVQQLLEGDLNDLTRVLLLMKHTGMPRTRAEELAKKLNEFTFIVGGKKVSANLRWVEDKTTGTLKFISAEMPGSWKSGAAASSRHRLVKLLMEYGFSIARLALYAVQRKHDHGIGPHVFFWGAKTPPPSQKQLEKVDGTPEHRAAYTARMEKWRRERESAPGGL